MRSSNDDYGRRVNLALTAVRRMHADVSKLLVDADGTIGKGKVSLFGNNATQGLSYNVKTEYWMAYFVYRFYEAAEGTDPNLVEAINVWFFHPRIEEPCLMVGQVGYDIGPEKRIKDVCQVWDLAMPHLEWSSLPMQFGVIHSGLPPTGWKRPVRWFKVIAEPLYNIESINDVTGLMDRVRIAEIPGSIEEQPGRVPLAGG
jgi:hypothetical protein